MRIIRISSQWESPGVTVTGHVDSVTLPAGTWYTAGSIATALAGLTDINCTLSQTTGIISFAGGAGWSIDLSDSTLATFIGAPSTAISSGTTMAPVAGWLRCGCRLGLGTLIREKYDDVIEYGGRLVVGSAVQTDACDVYLHHRLDGLTYDAALTAAYAAANSWVRSRISIIQESTEYSCVLQDGWILEPESLDSDVVSIRLEVEICD